MWVVARQFPAPGRERDGCGARDVAGSAFVIARLLLCIAAVSLTGCGYHVSGHSDLLPTNIKTIAIPAFGNITGRYRLTDLMPRALTREFISRTRYQVVADERNADAVLKGAVVNYCLFRTSWIRTGRRRRSDLGSAPDRISTTGQPGRCSFPGPAWKFENVTRSRLILANISRKATWRWIGSAATLPRQLSARSWKRSDDL